MASTLSRYMKDHEELNGWRFDPSDELLVSNYLLNKIIGKEFSDFQKIFVRDYDLYGDEEPFDIWNKFEGEENRDLFFITTLKNLKKKNNEKGLRYDRKVGRNGGKWHGEDAGREFEVSVTISGTEKTVKAIRKRFNYRNPRSDQHGLWIMHEYSLELNDQYVICRLRKNIRGGDWRRSKKRGSIAAAATDIVEYSANKRMRETMQNDALQFLESEVTCENQNQLVQHEYVPEYDHSEVPECYSSKFIESQNIEQTFHSIDATGEELESAFSGQQEAVLLGNQNVEALSEAKCVSSTVGDVDNSMAVDEWDSCINELFRDFDDGCELLGTFESKGFEETYVALTSCVEPVQAITSVQDADFQGEPSRCVDDFSSALLKISSFGQQEYEFLSFGHAPISSKQNSSFEL